MYSLHLWQHEVPVCACALALGNKQKTLLTD